jgi:hypothetical protein
MENTEQPMCIGCDALGPPTGHGKRWRLCSTCRAAWTKKLPQMDRPLPEEDSDFKAILRMAILSEVNVFDALVRAVLRHRELVNGPGEILTEDARLLHDRFGAGYSYTPGVKSKLLKSTERMDRAERKRRAELGLPPIPFPGEAAKQRQVKYRLKAKAKLKKAKA